MKLASVFSIICVLLIQYQTIAYRTDISEDTEDTFCEYRKHLTFKPTATCCGNKSIRPGLDYSTHWDTCVTQNSGKFETVEGIGWGIYACILKAATNKDELTLQEFADVITPKYPADIRDKINEEISSLSIPAAPLTDSDKLEKLRVTYYDIEKEVCEGMPNGESKSYGKIEMCSSVKEENHRAGMCCNKSYPVDIRYRSVFDAGDAESIQKCDDELKEQLVLYKLNATELMRKALLEICDVACYMFAKNGFDFKDKILNNRDWFVWNMTEQLDSFPLIPKFLHSNTIQNVRNYLMSNSTFFINSTAEAMQNYEFADVVGGASHTERSTYNIYWVHRGQYNETVNEGFKYEFMGRRFHRGILHVPIFCSAYREVVSLAEHYVFKNCQPEDVTEAPATAPVVTPAPEAEPEAEAEPEKADPTEEPTPTEDQTTVAEDTTEEN